MMETKYMVILPVWTLCVTVAFNAKIHFTISLIVCVSGVKFVKSVEGYSNSIKPSHFLNFFFRGGRKRHTNGGEKALQRGDNFMVDKAPTHRPKWFSGIVYLQLAFNTYSSQQILLI